MQAAAETTGKEDLLFVEFVTAKRLVCKDGHSLVELRPACSIRYWSPPVSSSANDSFKKFTGARSRRPHNSHLSLGRQNRRSSFCCGRGENLVAIARFGKPLFANMHHHVHAVAGALRKPNFACPHPDVCEAALQLARDSLVSAQARQAFYYDQGRKEAPFKVGDSVLVHREF